MKLRIRCPECRREHMLTITEERVKTENSMVCNACRFEFKWRVPDKKDPERKNLFGGKETLDMFNNMFGGNFKF